MTLAGFDSFKIQRAEQSFLFLGDGSEDGNIPSGTLCLVKHKDKEVMNALDGAGAPATDAEVQHELTAMSQTNMFRPGLDVTQAILLPQVSWKRREKTETVGPWKAKVYDMHNVVLSLKSRRVPGAMSDTEFFSSCSENETESELEDALTEEERKQLKAALQMDSSEMKPEKRNGVIPHRHSCHDLSDIPIEEINSCRNRETTKQEKKGWFGGWRRVEHKRQGERKTGTRRSSSCVEEEVGNLEEKISKGHTGPGRISMEVDLKRGDHHGVKNAKEQRKDGNGSNENEYKKGLRPILWLSPDFPLQTEELLPLLVVLANKVKVIRRLRELLTTRLPKGTFPVKGAIPVVPTIRVIVTFTKLDELQPLENFVTPPSSPTSSCGESPTVASSSSSSWFQWTKPPHQRKNETTQDVFAITSDYTWITTEAKRKKMLDKTKQKKAKGKK